MNELERNKKLVAEYVDAFNRCDAEALRRIFAPDAILQGVLGSVGMGQALAIWRELHQAFGINLYIEEIIAEGDRVAVLYVERGRFVSSFRGQPPTGRSYELPAMEWFIMRNGRIQEHRGMRDSASHNRQIGLAVA